VAVLLDPEELSNDKLEAEGVEFDRHLIGFSVREPGLAAPDIRPDEYYALLANAADFLVERYDANILFIFLCAGYSTHIGVDLGFNRVAVTSDGKFHTAKNIRHKKTGYKRTRRSLQANGSKSAKRALRRVSGRERRFIAYANHRLSKQIVADAKANNQRVVLEDLNGIRETGKAKCVHEWSFAQLQWMIRYKAAGAGVEVVDVSPRYTSQTCSRCLHLGVRPNQSSFECSDCGYRINADLNGAKSVAARHDLVAKGRYFCEYPREEVKGHGERFVLMKRSVRHES